MSRRESCFEQAWAHFEPGSSPVWLAMLCDRITPKVPRRGAAALPPEASRFETFQHTVQPPLSASSFPRDYAAFHRDERNRASH